MAFFINDGGDPNNFTRSNWLWKDVSRLPADTLCCSSGPLCTSNRNASTPAKAEVGDINARARTRERKGEREREGRRERENGKSYLATGEAVVDFENFMRNSIAVCCTRG